MQILEHCAFRCHVLYPKKVVGAVKDHTEQYWIRREERAGGIDLYYWHDEFLFSVKKEHLPGYWTQVTMRAEKEIWIQEPGISVIVQGNGKWIGLGRKGRITGGPFEVKQKDAHKSTIHFKRIWNSREFTKGVRYTEGDKVFTLWLPDPPKGFSSLLSDRAVLKPEDYIGCQVFDEDYSIVGKYDNPNEVLRRLELAGLPPDITQMHLLGWTGGPACCVNEGGRAEGKMDQIYNPPSWRKMKHHQEIVQRFKISAS